MLRPRLTPPRDIFPVDPWGVGAARFDRDLLQAYTGQAETMFALANGYLGIRGTRDNRWKSRVPI